MKLVSVLFQAIERISQTNKNTLSEAWNKSEKHRIRQKAKNFGCLSYSTPISQTGISQKGNFWVSGLFQGQKVSGLFCTLRGKWVSGLFWGRISGLFCGLVWLSIVTPLKSDVKRPDCIQGFSKACELNQRSEAWNKTDNSFIMSDLFCSRGWNRPDSPVYNTCLATSANSLE